MIDCAVCGNSKIPDSDTICPDCGTELVPPGVVPGGVANAATTAAPSINAAPAIPLAASSVPAQPTPAADASLGCRASLTIIRGGGLTKEKLSWAGDLVVIGKFDVDQGPVDVDLSQLPEAGYVSRRHCQIWADQSGQWFVKDLGSSNGTFLKAAGDKEFRKALGEQAIKDGDELALGNARFLFHAEPSHA